MALTEALDVVEPGCFLGIGGGGHETRPVASVHELIRRGTGGLRLVGGPSAGYDIDLLIGCGLVAETFIPAVTMGELGMAPMFRAAGESGEVKLHLLDVLTLVAGYQASALGLPFFPVDAWRGTQVVEHNPFVTALPDPFAGTFAVRPLVPDVALLHGAEGDEFGNVRSYAPMRSMDQYLAAASRKVIVTVDRLVSNDAIRREPELTTIPGIRVDAVCLVPFGAYPTACPPLYPADVDHLAFYRAAAEAKRLGDTAAYQQYLDRYVLSVRSADDYVDRVSADRAGRLRIPADMA
jgi:glutaconate CoA-transferase subunit A